MTTSNTPARTPQPQGRFRLPDPPEDPEDKMTSFDHLTITGSAHYLAQHLGNPETTLVAGDRYLVVSPTLSLAGSRYPDLLVAFDADPAAYKSSNGYIISEQGKPPDFVLEIASRSTGHIDATEKREDYAALGIGEYWRFDETGEYHRTRLAGERLVDGVYIAIEIEELPGGSLQGYSPVLGPEHPVGAGRTGVLRPGRWTPHRYLGRRTRPGQCRRSGGSSLAGAVTPFAGITTSPSLFSLLSPIPAVASPGPGLWPAGPPPQRPGRSHGTGSGPRR